MPPTPSPLIEQVTDSKGRRGIAFNFHPGQQKAWDSDKDIVAVIAGVRAGKTSFIPPFLHREMMRKGPGDYLVAAPSFPLLDIGARPEIDSFFGALLRLGSPSARRFTISEDGHRRLWPGEPIERERHILYGHAQNPESLAAMTVKAACLDEPGQKAFRLASFEEIERRVSFNRGRILMTTTVYDLSWLKTRIYDPWIEAKRNHDRIEVVNFKTIDNPAFPREKYYEAARTLPLWKFLMFYDGVFVRPAGLIYDRFDPVRHVRPRFRLDPSWPRFGGLDFGAVNTAAIMLAGELGPDRMPTGRYYAYREYHPGKMPPETHAVNLLKDEPITPLFVGGSRSEDDWRARFRTAGVPVIEPPVNDVEVQIDSLYQLIANDQLLVMDDMVGLLDELASYSRVLDDAGEATDAIDEDQLYHFLASARYLACWLVRGGGAPFRATRSDTDRSATADIPSDVLGKREEDDRPARSGRITHGDEPLWLDERFPNF